MGALQGLAVAALAAAGTARPEAVTLENDHVRWTIDAGAARQSFVIKATGADLAAGPLPVASLHDEDGWHAANSIAASEGTWRIGFAARRDHVTLRAKAEPDHLLLEFVGQVPKGVDRIVFAQTRLKVPLDTLGSFWPMGEAGNRHVLFAALSPYVRTSGFPSNGIVFRAEAVDVTGFDNVRLAVLVTPKEGTLAAIERLELKYRLPHLTLGGKWFRVSDELRRPYLFTDLTESNADRVIEFARRGGFGYVLTFSGVWSTGCGHYVPNKRNYPHGLAGLKRVSDKLHAAGLKFGIHLLSACISSNDAYLRPVPDRRLAVAGTFTLASDIDAGAREVPVDSSPAGMTTVDSYGTRGCDLWIDDEIVGYAGYTTAAPFSFTGCRRGRYGTTPAAHKAGASVRYLHRMYNMFLPDPKTDLLPEIGARIAEVCNRCGVDMIYFDGGEAVVRLGRYWHDSHWIHREVAKRLRREVLITGSGGNRGFGWHVHMRGNANDGVNVRTRRYLDEHKVPDRIAIYHRNLAAAEMGWLNLRSWAPSYPATQPDEWEYFCVKALAHDAPVSLHMHTFFFDKNGRAGECLDIIRRYEDVRRSGRLPAGLLAKLREPRREFRLLSDPKGGWSFRRMQYGPTRLVEPGVPGGAAWRWDNPFGDQPLWVRIRARAALKRFGDKDNVVLFDPAGNVAWHAEGRGGARCSATLSREAARDGRPSLKLTGRAAAAARGSRAWVRHEFARRLDLLAHRSLGLWVKGDGSGAVLDVQLVDASLIRARDYLVRIDFTGWRNVRLVDADFDAAFEHDLFRHKGNLSSFDFAHVRELRLQLAGMPKPKPVTVQVGRIEALREVPARLVKCVLNVDDRALRLPVALEPDDMVEVLPDGTAILFDRSNKVKNTYRLKPPLPAVKAGGCTLRLRAEGDAPLVYVTPILTGPYVRP